jgi:hypothetical protein
MIAPALILSFLLLAIVIGASAVVSARAWRDRPVLAPVYAVLGLALVAQVIWLVFWASPWLGITTSVLVVVASVGVLVRARPWTTWRAWAPIVALTASTGLFTVGLAFLYGGAGDPLTTFTNRFMGLPSDNSLQHLFADKLWRGGDLSTPLLSDWQGSDRPPLQSGLLLLVRPFGLLLGISPGSQVFSSGVLAMGMAASLTAQLVWVPAVHAMVRVLGHGRRTASVTVLFCAISPVVFVNTMYTWPKLLAGGLGVAAVALLADMILQRRWSAAAFGSAVALAVLSFLSHGTTAFAVPLFLGLGLAVLRRADVATALRGCLVAASACVFLYLPWALYGKWADPFTGRLMKWHLAGVIAPDDQSFGSALRHAYTSTPVPELLSRRLSNLQTAFVPDPRTRLSFGHGWTLRVRFDDFFHTPWALGWAFLFAVWMVGVYLWSPLRTRRQTRHRATVSRGPSWASFEVSTGIVLLSFASIVFWAMVMFLPDATVVHQGSLVWMLTLLALPFAWAWDRHRKLAATALVLTGVYVAVVYGTSNATLTELSPVGAVTLFGGTALLIASVFAGERLRLPAASRHAGRAQRRTAASGTPLPGARTREVTPAQDQPDDGRLRSGSS